MMIRTRISLKTRTSLQQGLRRIDRIAADLNVLLVVVAIGLAALDVTFLVTQKVMDRLPQVHRVVYDTEPVARTAPPTDPAK